MKPFFIAGFSLFLLAGVSVGAKKISPHTTHHIFLKNGADWQGRLVITSAKEPAFFTNKHGTSKGQMYDFALNKKTAPFAYGFGFNKGADFNVSYTLTLYQSAGDFKHGSRGSFFSTKGCQFNVSAKSPANPDIRVENYNGAICSYKVVPGLGEDFTVG